MPGPTPSRRLGQKSRFGRMAEDRKLKNAGRKARKPLGRALNTSDAELDRLAEITPADLEEADELWRSAVDRPLKDALRAEADEEDE